MNPPSEVKGPSFIGIGVPRSGTTWLSHNLRKHPHIFLTPVKELRYFSGRHKSYISKLIFMLRRLSKNRPHDNKQWIKHWGTSWPETDEWYLNLFQYNNSLPAGEISPIYCTLSVEEVKRVRILCPAAQIILLLRDPIDRDWSHAKFVFHLKKKRKFPLPVDKYLEYYQSKPGRMRTDYVSTVRNWTSIFGKDRVYIGFYEDIQNNPTQVLREICKHIGVDENLSAFHDEKVSRKINSSKLASCPPPAEVLNFLAHRHSKWLGELERMLPGTYVENWNARCQMILEENS